jgi:trehalose synthase
VARVVEIDAQPGLAEHAAVAHLASAVATLRETARRVARVLDGRTIWMINSTAQGGGVAEMLPAMIGLLRDLGLRVEWAVIESSNAGFFNFTKRIHNLIHDVGSAAIDPADVALYERVNRDNAAALAGRLAAGDIVVVHDPQPLPLGPILRESRDVHLVWRCHIGLDERTARTVAAWSLLQPYAQAYDEVVFSAREYVPPFLADRATIIHPAVDPLAPKNRDLSLHKIVGVLASAGLTKLGPTLSEPYAERVLRVTPTGETPAIDGSELGLLTRPIVTQISRWDRLKGFLPLLQAFARLKQTTPADAEHRRRIELMRLVLAGPVLGTVTDDPEAAGVVDELRAAYAALPPRLREDIGLLLLPMSSREENALIVNALQRSSSIVAQNSLREGFGLTIAEAMWKRVPVFSSARACGPRTQITDGVEGCLVRDPEDVAGVAETLDTMLRHPDRRETWARNAQRRAHDQFMIFTQLQNWIELWNRLVTASKPGAR